MKCLKTLAVAVIAVAALAAFAGSASATSLTVTTENGSTDTLPAGATLSAELAEGEVIWKSTFIGEVKCKESTIAGAVTNAGGATETVQASVSTLTFTSCNANMTVLKNGSLEFHTEGEGANGNGTLTSSGMEVTLELAGLHCIFATSNTDIGPVTGTHAGHVIIHVPNSVIPRTGGRSGAFCGTSYTVRATYTITGATYNGNFYTNFTID